MMPSSSAAHRHSVAASLPAGTRVYAVGDIHGRADLLAETIARIEEDQQRRPVAQAVEIYLGDYVDRGPDSRSVIDMLAARLVRHGAVCLRGNHDALLDAFIHDFATLEIWRPLGALATLASYGVVPESGRDSDRDMHARFLNALPRAHVLFLQCLRDSFVCGDFLFVHAGIRPGVAIEHQRARDLMWIRGEFLDSPLDHGTFVVHGHTPVPHLDIRHNRVNIDTGAWKTGVLTCIAIEGDSILPL